MHRRLFSTGLIALLLTSAPLPAFAKDGNSGKGKGGGDDDSGDGDGNDNSGPGNNNDNGNPDSGPGNNSGKSGKGGGDDDRGDDDGGGNDDHGGDGGSSGTGKGSSVSDDDHDQAKHAVDTRAALPLTQMMALFRRYGNFTVIDVKLAERDKSLLYVFKYIDNSGNVRKAYFDAQTGALVK